jgi:parvulin-like peptidyl-prolyl isomerase
MEKEENNEMIKENKDNVITEIGKESMNDSIRVSKKLIYGMLIFIVLGIGVFAFFSMNSSSDEGVAAIVNGEIITISELDNAYETLPPQYKGVVSKGSLLEQLVQAKVIYQEAEKQGIIVSEEEAVISFNEIKLTSGLSEEQFKESLEAQGTSEDEVIEQFSKQLTIQKFLDENLLNKIEISDDEIQDYYTSNSLEYQIDEQVTVKHILVGENNLTEDEQDKLAKRILSELTEDNFCIYVAKYTEDSASISDCGEYTFSMKDGLVEEFKELSFKQKGGDMGIVRTQFGNHIIWTVEKTPARNLEINEVKDNIYEVLKAEKGQDMFSEYYDELSKGSDIEIKFSEI